MATLKREVKKLPSESNLRLLSSLIVSLANKQSSLEDKCIAPWKADETYQKDISYVSYNGYVYICSVTNQDSVFTESHWTKLADEFTELDVDTIKSYLNLTQEQITNLQSLIDDTTITTTKTNSSSKIYMDIQAAIAECKDDTLKQIAKKVSGSYKIATSTAEVTSADHIYLINNGANYDLYVLVDSVPTKVGDTSIDLSDYAKLTDLDSYYDKATSDGKYALITTVDGKVDKTSIVTTIDSSSTDDKVPTAKAVINGIRGKTNFTYRGDITSLEEMNNAIEIGYYRVNLAPDSSHSGVIPTYGVMTTHGGGTAGFTGYDWFFQLYMTTDGTTEILYRKSINSSDANGWTKWKKVLIDTDITNTINHLSTDTQVPSALAVETRVNKVNKCTVYSNEDLNLITEPGLYACVGGDTYGATHNFPVPDNGYLQHIAYPADGYCMQTFVPNGVWGGELNMYVRRLRSGVWSSWQRLCGTTIQDGSGTGTLSDGASGIVYYKVKNGVAYVSVHELAEGLTGSMVCTITGLPKADGYVNVGIEKLGSRVGTIYTDDGTTFYVHKTSTDGGYASFSYLVAE